MNTYTFINWRTMRRQKLTLSIDPEVIAKAKVFSRRHSTSISELVTRFLRRLGESEEADAPVVARLRGLLPPDVGREQQREGSERKHWR